MFDARMDGHHAVTSAKGALFLFKMLRSLDRRFCLPIDPLKVVTWIAFWTPEGRYLRSSSRDTDAMMPYLRTNVFVVMFGILFPLVLPRIPYFPTVPRRRSSLVASTRHRNPNAFSYPYEDQIVFHVSNINAHDVRIYPYIDNLI